jgi:hypothetical protein
VPAPTTTTVPSRTASAWSTFSDWTVTAKSGPVRPAAPTSPFSMVCMLRAASSAVAGPCLPSFSSVPLTLAADFSRCAAALAYHARPSVVFSTRSMGRPGGSAWCPDP